MSEIMTSTEADVQEVPTDLADAVNAQILAVSEDRIQGFCLDPFGEIAQLSGVPRERVLERVRAMLQAGTIRRVRQTLMATNLAPGALVAWQVPEEKLQSAFDWMFQNDPFSGHVVIRSTDADIAGARYRLWTTLKVPQDFSMERIASGCASKPARRRFALCRPSGCLRWEWGTCGGAAWSRAAKPTNWLKLKTPKSCSFPKKNGEYSWRSSASLNPKNC
jgi:hypothetical protein